MTSKGWPRFLACILAISIPLGIVLFWHFLNRTYPRGDQGFFFDITQQIYRVFRTEGFLQGLGGAYSIRGGYKPLLIPVFGVPFIALFGGRVPQTIGATESCLFALFLIYAFQMAREFTTPLKAILLVICIGTVPWVLINAYYYNMEAAFLAFTMAGLFHLKRAPRFESRLHGALFGIFLGLCFCCRPIETALFFLPALAVIVGVAFKNRLVTSRELLGSAVVLVIGIFCLTVAIRGGEQYSVSKAAPLLAGLPVVVILNVLLTRRKGLPVSGFSLAFSLAFSIAVLWALPSMYYIYFWAYGCSFGKYAVSTGLRLDPVTGKWATPPAAFFFETIRFLGTSLLPCGVVAAIIGMRHWSRKTDFLRSHAPFAACILLMVFVPIIIGSFTYNVDRRYYYTSGLVLMFCCSWVIAKYAPVLFLIPIALQSYFVCADSYHLTWQRIPQSVSELIDLKWPDFYEVPRFHRADPTKAFVQAVEESVKTAERPHVAILLYGNIDWGWLLHPMTLPILESELNLTTKFGQLYPDQTISLNLAMSKVHEEMLNQKFNYAVLGNELYTRMQESNQLNRGFFLVRQIEAANYDEKAQSYWLVGVRPAFQSQ